MAVRSVYVLKIKMTIPTFYVYMTILKSIVILANKTFYTDTF